MASGCHGVWVFGSGRQKISLLRCRWASGSFVTWRGIIDGYNTTAGRLPDCICASHTATRVVRLVDKSRLDGTLPSRYLSEQHFALPTLTFWFPSLMLSLSPRSVCSWMRSSRRGCVSDKAQSPVKDRTHCMCFPPFSLAPGSPSRSWQPPRHVGERVESTGLKPAARPCPGIPYGFVAAQHRAFWHRLICRVSLEEESGEELGACYLQTQPGRRASNAYMFVKLPLWFVRMCYQRVCDKRILQ